MKISLSCSRCSLLMTWLIFETAFDAWMAIFYIPAFYGDKVFVTSTEFDPSSCSSVLYANSTNLTQHANSSIQPLSDLPSQIEHIADACMNVTGSRLSDAVNYQLYEEPNRNASNYLNGIVLLICGLLAPSFEMVMRIVYNLMYLLNVVESCPRFYQGFERYVYKALKDPLKHLSQFKLFLCFLQMLLSLKMLGLDMVRMAPGPGLNDFVKYVLYSIFLNSVVKKIEIPMKAGEKLFPAIMPKKDWVKTVLAPEKMHTRTIISIVQLVGFYVWITLPVFTMVFKFTLPDEVGEGVTEVKYYTSSFMPIREGFSKLNSDPLMWILLVFQLLWCNLAAAVFQLVYAVMQEWKEWMPAAQRKVALEPFGDLLTKYEALDDEDAEPSLTQKVVSLCLCGSVENQCHEYFLCALAMVMYVMLSWLEFDILDNDSQVPSCAPGFEVLMCFNPLICLWLLCSVLLLGQARAKLYAKGARHEFGILIFQLTLAVIVVYFMIFADTEVYKYFGDWTLQKEYVTDHETGKPFDCFSDGRAEHHCISVKKNGFVEMSPFAFTGATLSFTSDLRTSMKGLMNATLHCLPFPLNTTVAR
mmetsp:Transcript_33959/g.61970  ORF Transcript_33959/g.61970 Transcript_33959/m.61970 type:complete len:586 (-) Transcript_33959:84-1841(-)